MTTTAPLPVDDGTTPVHDTPEVEAEESAWRYKGSAPFGDDELDRRLFCGRKNEITTVIHSILSHDLLLVYAVSGMGKTSLLSAGVFEPLRERGYWPIIVRLNDPSKRIVELIDERLRSADAADDEIEITRNPSLPPLDVATATLWDLLAGLEVWKGNSLQRPVLVFDQFEELFTLPWDEHDRAQFIVSFGEVIRRHRSEPQSLTDFDRTTAADTERAVDAGAAPPVAPPPPNIKVVLVMREDSLGELERLAADVPQILQHRFRLEGLDPEQAMAAITEPAQVSDPNLKSHTFKYQDEAAATILEFLRSRQERGRTVTSRFAEPPQLQIICEHVERTILPGKRPSDEPDAVVEITDADLGGRDGLQRILRDFYRTKLQMFARKDRRRVRELCETGLITPSHRRLSLEQESIEQQFHVSKATLDKLVEHRVLRVETRLDSSYYELAHDTMVPPILAYRESAAAARRRKVRRWITAVAFVIAVGIMAAVVALLAMGEDDDRAPEAAIVDMAVGEAVESEFTEGVEQHLYEFEGTGEEALVVTVVPDGDLAVSIDVTDPRGDRAAGSASSSEASGAIVSGDLLGNYRISLVSLRGTTGSYELRASPVAIVELDEQGSSTESIARLGDVKMYDFEAPATPIVIALTPGRGLDAVLTVTDPEGSTTEYNNAGPGKREAVLTTLPGRHRVVVSAAGSTVGSFDVSLESPQVEPIAVGGVPTSDRIAGSGDVRLFEFDAPAEPTNVVVLPSRTLDAVLTVSGPDGVTTTYDGTGAGDRETVLVTQQGRHQVLVSGFATTFGSFELSVDTLPTSAVAVDEALVGRTSGSADPAAFVFDAVAGEFVNVRVEPSTENDVWLQVIDPSGNILEADFGGAGEPEAVAVLNAQSGRHVIVVTASGGTFEVVVDALEVVTVVEGDVVRDRLDTTTNVFVGQITMDEGSEMTIAVHPDEQLDPVVEVYGPDGLIDYFDEGGAGDDERAIITADVAGDYRFAVMAFSGASGEFELTVATDD